MKIQTKSPQIANFYGDSKVLCRSIFSAAGSFSDSVKRHLRGRHLSVLNLKFDFISDGGCTREEQIALSLKRHLFPHGGREPKVFWICFSRVHPPSEIKSNFKFKTLKRHLLKRHLTLSDLWVWSNFEKLPRTFQGLPLFMWKFPDVRQSRATS